MNITDEVLELKQRHITTWRNQPEWFWMVSLLEEVVELGLSLIGLHVGPPDWELKQIAAICLNWLEMRENRRIVK